MASANIITLDDNNFRQEVINSDIPVLVDFWAEWCGPCKSIAPTIDRLADMYAGKVKVCKLDTDASSETPRAYGIMGIPAVLFFKNGEIVSTLTGARNPAEYQGEIQKLLI